MRAVGGDTYINGPAEDETAKAWVPIVKRHSIAQ